MNNRERVLTVLKHEQPDRIPYNIHFTQKAHAKMVQFYGDPCFAEKLGNCLTNISSEPENSWNEVSADIWEDQFGVRWNRRVDKDIGAVCNCRIRPDNIDEYQFPNPDDMSRYRNYNDP